MLSVAEVLQSRQTTWVFFPGVTQLWNNNSCSGIIVLLKSPDFMLECTNLCLMAGLCEDLLTELSAPKTL